MAAYALLQLPNHEGNLTQARPCCGAAPWAPACMPPPAMPAQARDAAHHPRARRAARTRPTHCAPHARRGPARARADRAAHQRGAALRGGAAGRGGRAAPGHQDVRALEGRARRLLQGRALRALLQERAPHRRPQGVPPGARAPARQGHRRAGRPGGRAPRRQRVLRGRLSKPRAPGAARPPTGRPLWARCLAREPPGLAAAALGLLWRCCHRGPCPHDWASYSLPRAGPTAAAAAEHRAWAPGSCCGAFCGCAHTCWRDEQAPANS